MYFRDIFIEIMEENGWEEKHPGTGILIQTNEFKGFNFIELSEGHKASA